MNLKHVEGINKGHIMLYALSTCVWCKKTKALFDELGLDYYYVDVDLEDEETQAVLRKEIMKWNRSCSFPTIVIDDERCIPGYEPLTIKKLAGK
jgi:glutaredoxin